MLTQRVMTAIAAAAIAVGLAAVGDWNAGESRAQERPWGAAYIPNLEVTPQNGTPVHFYDDLVKGKIVIISFIYTSCTDICPLTTARMAMLEDKLGDLVGRDVFLLSMTVDPEHDTPQRMKEYADTFGAGPGWSFVTGTPENVRAINYKFGERSQVLSEHRNEIVLGNDATGEWQRDNLFGDIDRLAMTVRSLDPKWRDQVRAPVQQTSIKTGLALSPQPGQAMFKKMCAPCHTIGVGDRVGPDLRGVTTRRDPSWLADFVRNPARLRAEHDPVALALAEQFPTVRMPGLGLTPNDAADLISYLAAETTRLSDAEVPMPSDHQHHHH